MVVHVYILAGQSNIEFWGGRAFYTGGQADLYQGSEKLRDYVYYEFTDHSAYALPRSNPNQLGWSRRAWPAMQEFGSILGTPPQGTVWPVDDTVVIWNIARGASACLQRNSLGRFDPARGFGGYWQDLPPVQLDYRWLDYYRTMWLTGFPAQSIQSIQAQLRTRFPGQTFNYHLVWNQGETDALQLELYPQEYAIRLLEAFDNFRLFLYGATSQPRLSVYLVPIGQMTAAGYTDALTNQIRLAYQAIAAIGRQNPLFDYAIVANHYDIPSQVLHHSKDGYVLMARRVAQGILNHRGRQQAAFHIQSATANASRDMINLVLNRRADLRQSNLSCFRVIIGADPRQILNGLDAAIVAYYFNLDGQAISLQLNAPLQLNPRPQLWYAMGHGGDRDWSGVHDLAGEPLMPSWSFL